MRCAEPGPVVAETRLFDEAITVVNEPTNSNLQVDRAMAGVGLVQNLKKEQNTIVTRGTTAMAVDLR